jgi:restriction system protein
MAIPDFQSIMLPLLQFSSDGKEHSVNEAVEWLAQHFALSQSERNELLPSGRQAILANRAAWAGTYFRKAGLLEKTGRAKFRITERGLQILQAHPDRVDIKVLNQFPEFVKFHSAKHTDMGKSNGGIIESEPKLNPEEALESSYQDLRETLAEELLSRVLNASPKFLEQLVIDLMLAIGYGGSRKDAGQAIGGTGDDGIDGILKEDELGLDIIYLQAKRWARNRTIGRPEVQAFVGSLEGHRAKKGVFITTARYSAEARDYIARIEKKIVLIDGEQLAGLMIDHGIGVTEVNKYVIKKADSDYFEEAF